MSFFQGAKHLAQLGGRFSRTAVFCFAFMLLVSQSVSLGHAHDNDLTRHLDCEMCLHIGGLDHAITSGGISFDVTAFHFQIPPTRTEHIGESSLRPNARAPPLSY